MKKNKFEELSIKEAIESCKKILTEYDDDHQEVKKIKLFLKNLEQKGL